MPPVPRRVTPAGLAVAALAAALLVAGCGGDDDTSGASTAATAAPATTAPATTAPATTAPGTTAPTTTAPTADPGLPDELAGFRSGLRMNREPIPQDSAAPHGEVKNVYVNRTRQQVTGRSADAPYPDGTVVVKTGSRGDDMAAIVAVMTKRRDADPQHGDWTFIEYARQSPDEPYTVLAQDSVCWGCHAGAQSTDWVFTRVE